MEGTNTFDEVRVLFVESCEMDGQSNESSLYQSGWTPITVTTAAAAAVDAVDAFVRQRHVRSINQSISQSVDAEV